jgi:hypothetical protein
MIERFLLDTNIIAEIVKQGRDSGVVGVIAQMGEGSICTSAVVASELRFGLDRRAQRRCRRKSSAPCASPRYCPMPPAARSSTASSARGQGRSGPTTCGSPPTRIFRGRSW